MILSRRLFMAGGVAALWELNSHATLAIDGSEFERKLAAQQASLERSKSSNYPASVGFEELAKDPHLHLNDYIKNIGFLIKTPDNGSKNRARLIKSMRTGKFEDPISGTVTNFGAGIVGLDAHEVQPGYLHHVIFTPAPGVYAKTIVEFREEDIDRKLDLAFGRMKDLPAKIENAGFLPVKWGNQEITKTSDEPIVSVGFYGGILHASIGRPNGYFNAIKAKAFGGEIVSHSCKESSTAPIVHGQSGGITGCAGFFIGMNATGTFHGKNKDLSVGSKYTPAESIAIALAARFPAETAKIDFNLRPEFIRNYKEAYPECSFGS